MSYKVNLYTKTASLCEIYQQVQMGFALCKGEKKGDDVEVTQSHPFVLCRDFLSDALYANNKKRSWGIYGFTFDGTSQSVSTDSTYLLVKVPNNECGNLIKNLRVLHYYESMGKWRKTKVVDTGLKHQDKKIFLFISTGKWVSSTQLISLYTLLIRCMWKDMEEGELVVPFLKRIAAGSDNDAKYLKSVFKVEGHYKTDPIAMCVKYNRRIFENTYNFSGVISSFHDRAGIQSLMNYFAKKAGIPECYTDIEPGVHTFVKNSFEEFNKRAKAATKAEAK